jgi:hypothetical protein
MADMLFRELLIRFCADGKNIPQIIQGILHSFMMSPAYIDY